MEAGRSREAAYSGRGASAFGALSRAVFTLRSDGGGGVVLECAKIKGTKFEDVTLRLNPVTRWFEPTGQTPQSRVPRPTAQMVADYVETKGEARTAEIIEHYKPIYCQRAIEGCISEAERNGLITKANKQAPWRIRKAEAAQTEHQTATLANAGACENPQTVPAISVSTPADCTALLSDDDSPLIGFNPFFVPFAHN